MQDRGSALRARQRGPGRRRLRHRRGSHGAAGREPDRAARAGGRGAVPPAGRARQLPVVRLDGSGAPACPGSFGRTCSLRRSPRIGRARQRTRPPDDSGATDAVNAARTMMRCGSESYRCPTSTGARSSPSACGGCSVRLALPSPQLIDDLQRTSGGHDVRQLDLVGRRAASSVQWSVRWCGARARRPHEGSWARSSRASDELLPQVARDSVGAESPPLTPAGADSGTWPSGQPGPDWRAARPRGSAARRLNSGGFHPRGRSA